MSAHARANHCLYLARLVLDAWQGELDREQAAATTLAQAFAPAARQHLIRAYGWFLLEIVQPDMQPSDPPENCAGLPPVAEGKVLPGEVREFQQMERDGWLAELLQQTPAAVGTPKSSGNLAVSMAAGPRQYRQWSAELETIFDRMADSLDEY